MTTGALRYRFRMRFRRELGMTRDANRLELISSIRNRIAVRIMTRSTPQPSRAHAGAIAVGKLFHLADCFPAAGIARHIDAESLFQRLTGSEIPSVPAWIQDADGAL